MYICLSSSHSPVDMAGDSMGSTSGLAEGGRRARSQEAGVAARSICQLLPPFRFIGLNSKISPTKVDDEWWNTFCSLQKHPINGLVFLKKNMFTNALIAMHACINYMHWSIFS